MEDAESVLVPGYKLDRYELLCPIASGGMATVWLARLEGKRGFEKLFAIKTIKTELVTDPRFQAMFLDEARLASAIEHPNVAQILDLGEQDGILYTIMEWVDGESLAKIYRKAQKRGLALPLGVVLRILADACGGLHAAHELRDADDRPLGVVHRDVSPQNLLVTTGGAVKVIDFGVAKAKGRSAGDTKSGVVKGKIRYMAPEQVRSEQVDHRADLWAVGMCLLEIVTGKPPFDEHSDIEVVRLLMTDNPTPSFDGVPAVLRPIFAKSIVREPEKRFTSAAVMRKALEAVIDEVGGGKTDDVAAFLQNHLPDLAKKRRETITRAADDSKHRNVDRRREADVSLASTPPPDDVAYAETIASESGAAFALTRRKSSAPPGENKERTRVEDSRSTGGATLTEQLGERPKSRVGVGILAVLVLALGAWFGWPGSARIRAAFTPASTASAVPSTVSSAAATPSAPPTAVDLGDLPPTPGIDEGPRASSGGPRALGVSLGTSAAPASTLDASSMLAPVADAAAAGGAGSAPDAAPLSVDAGGGSGSLTTPTGAVTPTAPPPLPSSSPSPPHRPDDAPP